MYINKIKNHVSFEIKTGYKLETMRFQSKKQVVAKDKNGKNVPKLEMVYVLLMHCSVFNNNSNKHQNFIYIFT